MTTYTDYCDDISGNTLYAKPEPLVASPWATDRVVATENGTTGSYAFSLDSAKQYVVYRQLGGSPAISDLKLGRFSKNLELEIKEKTDLINSQFSAQAQRVVGSTIYAYVGSTKAIGPVSVVNDAGEAISLVGRNLRFCIASKSEEALFEYTPSISTNTFTVANIDASIRSAKRAFLWSLRDVDDSNEPLAFGDFLVIYAAERV